MQYSYRYQVQYLLILNILFYNLNKQNYKLNMYTLSYFNNTQLDIIISKWCQKDSMDKCKININLLSFHYKYNKLNCKINMLIMKYFRNSQLDKSYCKYNYRDNNQHYILCSLLNLGMKNMSYYITDNFLNCSNNQYCTMTHKDFLKQI